MSDKWIVQVKGKKCTDDFEISVVRASYKHGRRSYGWFNENKLLISHNGGPCHWPLTPLVWGLMMKLAEDVALTLNTEEA